MVKLPIAACSLWLFGLAVGPGFAAQPAAAAGAVLYERHCRYCHGATLQGSAYGTALRGRSFLACWGGHSREDLLAYNMPPCPRAAPG